MKRLFIYVLTVVLLLSGCNSTNSEAGTGLTGEAGSVSGKDENVTTDAVVAKYVAIADDNILIRDDGSIEYTMLNSSDVNLLSDGSAAVYIAERDDVEQLVVQRPGSGEYAILCTIGTMNPSVKLDVDGGYLVAETTEGLYYYPELDRGEAIKIGDYDVYTELSDYCYIRLGTDRSVAFVVKDAQEQFILYHVDLDVNEVTMVTTSDSRINLPRGVTKTSVCYGANKWENGVVTRARAEGNVTGYGNLYDYFVEMVHAEDKAYFVRKDGTRIPVTYVGIASNTYAYKLSDNEKYLVAVGDAVTLCDLSRTTDTEVSSYTDGSGRLKGKVFNDGTVLITNEKNNFGILQNGEYTQISDQEVLLAYAEYGNGAVYFVPEVNGERGTVLMKHTIGGSTEVLHENCARNMVVTEIGLFYLADSRKTVGTYCFDCNLLREGDEEPLAMYVDSVCK